MLPRVMVGCAFTEPLAETFCVVAPADIQRIFPPGVPLAELLKRTYTVVEVTIPPVCGKVKEAPNPDPELAETSYPAGGTILMLALR